MSTRLLITAALGLAIGSCLALPPPTVRADGSLQNGSTGASANGGQVTVDASGSKTGTVSNAGGSSMQCTSVPVDPAYADLLAPVTGPGQWVLPYCTGGPYVNPMNPVWISSVPAPSPAAVAEQAVSHLPLPIALVGMSPDPQHLTVNVATWLWVDRTMWHSLTATATVGSVAATATAAPTRVVWDLGNGSRLTRDGPGTPWTPQQPADQPNDCSYSYPQSSASQPRGTYTVTATVYWHVTWTSVGAPGGGDLGLIASPAAETSARVSEIHAINDQPQ